MLEMPVFWGREREMVKLGGNFGRGVFGYVTGRRRVGKTALLTEAVRRFGGIYHQAVEGTPSQQLAHFSQELGERLPLFREIIPKTWPEFFSLLSRQKLPPLIVFDEFSYWVQGDAALPSLLQKWIDHQLPTTKTALLISGSSQSMLYSTLLKAGAPLYGRASFRLDLAPLSFRWFCRALRYDEASPLSFERYSLVGGVPHYWKLLPRAGVVEQAAALYFEPSAILAEEPKHWLRDEGVGGTLPKAMLDLIGRGVAKPGELAGRLSTAHGNLTRPLTMLLDLGLIARDVPFGESPRSSKKALYGVADPSLSFYFGTYLSNRQRWVSLPAQQKSALIGLHASRQFEAWCRKSWPGSSRYWEGKIELDLVAFDPASKRLLVAECKWRILDAAQERGLINKLKLDFAGTKLARKYKNVDFRIFSKKDLGFLAKREAREDSKK